MQRTNIYLDGAQTAALEKLARAQGIFRAELVRRLIDRSPIAESADLDSDLAAIESSFGVFADEPVDTPRRRSDQRVAHLDAVRGM